MARHLILRSPAAGALRSNVPIQPQFLGSLAAAWADETLLARLDLEKWFRLHSPKLHQAPRDIPIDIESACVLGAVLYISAHRSSVERHLEVRRVAACAGESERVMT